MKTYKYTSPDNEVVHVIDEDGKSRESCLASLLEEGTVIEAADPFFIDPVGVLAEIDKKSIRSIREWIAKQADAPTFLKTLESQAVTERGKLK